MVATDQLTALVGKSGIPAVYPATEYVEAGGLFGYGVDTADLFRRAAAYVDKILKGANPMNLAVGLPTKFDLVINLKAAKEIGVKIPQSLLKEANRIVK